MFGDCARRAFRALAEFVASQFDDHRGHGGEVGYFEPRLAEAEHRRLVFRPATPRERRRRLLPGLRRGSPPRRRVRHVARRRSSAPPPRAGRGRRRRRAGHQSPDGGGASRPTDRVAPESRCSRRSCRVSVSMSSDRRCGGESGRIVIVVVASSARMMFASFASRRKASSWPRRAAAAAAAVQGCEPLLLNEDVVLPKVDRRFGTRISPRTDMVLKAGEKAGDAVDRRPPGVRRAVDGGACVAGVAVSSLMAEAVGRLRAAGRARASSAGAAPLVVPGVAFVARRRAAAAAAAPGVAFVARRRAAAALAAAPAPAARRRRRRSAERSRAGPRLLPGQPSSRSR